MATLGALLGLFGFAALIVALFGLVRQRVRWTRVIATRRDAGFLLVASLVLMGIALVLTPSPKSVPTAAAAADTGTTASQAPPVVPAPTTAAPVVIPAQRAKPTAAPALPSTPASVAAPAQSFAAAPARPAPAPAPAPAYSAPSTRSYAAPPPSTSGTTGAYNGGGSTDTYTNSDGNQVERPDGASAGASARCGDGSYSHSQHRSGTCSGHGGVAQRLNP